MLSGWYKVGVTQEETRICKKGGAAPINNLGAMDRWRGKVGLKSGRSGAKMGPSGAI